MSHQMSISDRKLILWESICVLSCASESVDVGRNGSKDDEMCPPSLLSGASQSVPVGQNASKSVSIVSSLLSGESE